MLSLTPPISAQMYQSVLITSPSLMTRWAMSSEAMVDQPTAPMADQCPTCRPHCLPPKNASRAPASGARIADAISAPIAALLSA